ncbi:hypothetical protein ACP70R_012005 [Stipagrostis hirtigluma subsp. patula]
MQILVVMDEDRAQLARWLQLLAAMPATTFSMAALTRLYLGFWRFPDTAGVPRGAAFPCLREPQQRRLRQPRHGLRPRQEPRSGDPLLPLHRQPEPPVRAVQCRSTSPMWRASPWWTPPRLEQLILVYSRPVAALVGYFEPGKHALQLFPNVERLHIQSNKTDESTGKLNLKFWKEDGGIECVRSHINLLIFHDFREERREPALLMFFVESAQMLKRLVTVYANGSFGSMAEAISKVKTLFTGRKAIQCCVSNYRWSGRVHFLKEVPLGTFKEALIFLVETLLCSLFEFNFSVIG